MKGKNFPKAFFMQAGVFVFTLLLLILSSCDNANTAGVITETESGRQVAGRVIDDAGNPVSNAEVFFVENDFIAARSLSVVTVTDSMGYYALTVEDSYTLALVSVGEFACAQKISFSDSSIQEVTLQMKREAVLSVQPSLYALNAGDTLCVVGALSCESVSLEDVENDILTIGVPEASYTKFIVLNGNMKREVDGKWNVLSGDTLTLNFFTADSTSKISSLNIPDLAYSAYELPDFAIPMRITESANYAVFEDGQKASLVGKIKNNLDSSLLYYAIAKKVHLNSSELNFKLVYENDSTENTKFQVVDLAKYAPSDSGILGIAGAFNAEESFYTPKEELFKDSSMFLSFWLHVDGESQADTAFTLFSAYSENAGFTIRQCLSNKTTLCLRIKSGLDSSAVDTTLYGNVKILDGKWHQYTVSIYKKHLTIVVDGEVEKNTDLKLSDDFYSATLLPFGGTGFNGLIDGFILGNFDTSIVESGESKWDKLVAWLRAFYYLQKSVTLN